MKRMSIGLYELVVPRDQVSLAHVPGQPRTHVMLMPQAHSTTARHKCVVSCSIYQPVQYGVSVVRRSRMDGRESHVHPPSTSGVEEVKPLVMGRLDTVQRGP